MAGNITIETATVPEGTCPSWIIERWPELVALLTATLNGSNNTVNVGSSTPDPEDQDKPWLKSDANGYPDGQYWIYKGGFWLKQHPLVAGIGTLWWGSSASIDTFDGGESAALSAITGPMWEIVTDLQAKFPIGVGTLPGGTILAVGSSGGEENHTLVSAELPTHSHAVFAASRDTDGGTTATRLAPTIDTGVSYGNTSEVGMDTPHNNMPPYSALHFIRRTTRLYYRA